MKVFFFYNKLIIPFKYQFNLTILIKTITDSLEIFIRQVI